MINTEESAECYEVANKRTRALRQACEMNEEAH